MKGSYNSWMETLIILLVGAVVGMSIMTLLFMNDVGGIVKNSGFMYQNDCKVTGYIELNNSNYKSLFAAEEINYDDYDSNLKAVWKEPNYSEVGYHQVIPGNSGFIFLECVNSTLKFDNTSIWCER
jgi:hypothetical protein